MQYKTSETVYIFKCPIETSPTKAKRLKAKDWDKYKGFMISMSKNKKTGKEITSVLQNKGLDVSLGAVKRRLKQWCPKYRKLNSKVSKVERAAFSLHRTSTIRTMALEDRKSKMSRMDRSIEETMEFDSDVDQLLPAQDAPGELDSNNHIHSPDRQNSMPQWMEDPNEAQLDAIGRDLVESLGLDLPVEADQNLKIPTFQEWEAQQSQESRDDEINATGGPCEIPEPPEYDAAQLVKMAEEMGEPDAPFNGHPRDFQLTENKPVDLPCGDEPPQELRSKVLEVEDLLDRSDKFYENSLFEQSFIASRDAYNITRRWHPEGHFLLGFALYGMAVSLEQFGRRLVEAIRGLERALTHFVLAKNETWELETMTCLAKIRFNWGNNTTDFRRSQVNILHRIRRINPSRMTPSQFDEVWVYKRRALRGLAKSLPPEARCEVHRKIVESSEKRYGLGHQQTLRAIESLGNELLCCESYKEVIIWMRRVYNAYISCYGSYNTLGAAVVTAASNLFYAYIKAKWYGDALSFLQSLPSGILASKLWRSPGRIADRGRLLAAFGYHYAVLKLLQRGLLALNVTRKEGHLIMLEVEGWIVESMFQRGLVMYAQPVADDYISRCERHFGKAHPATLDAILSCLRYYVFGYGVKN